MTLLIAGLLLLAPSLALVAGGVRRGRGAVRVAAERRAVRHDVGFTFRADAARAPYTTGWVGAPLLRVIPRREVEQTARALGLDS